MFSSLIVGFYAWTSLTMSLTIDSTFAVSLYAAIPAAIAGLICLVSYFYMPRKYLFITSLAIYYLIITTISILIATTGGLSSPFLVLWILLGIFAGIFGQWGLLPVFIAACVLATIKYTQSDLNTSDIIVLIIDGLVPLIVSILIWRSKSGRDEIDNDDRAYKNLANELNEVASKSEVVINAIGDGVIALDNKGIIQLINPAAQQIIGWSKHDALSLSYKSVFKLVNQNNEVLDPSVDPIQQVLNNNQQVRENDLSIMTKNGKKLMVSLVVSPVGEIGSGVIAVFHDVTKEKAEEREQAEFISTASHEMRTPVASIEGYLGLALNPQTAQIDVRAKDYIEKAHASATHLGHLFQDLLDVSKADDGRISNNPQVMNIVTFAHDVVQGLTPKAKEKGLKLIYKPMPDDTTERFIAPAYTVNVDNDHVREIINNLVENAIKYTPSGEITIDINGDDDHVIVSIKDSGIGIPAEDIPHLFQKFYRVDNKDTREIGGTGLGLYLCRRLTEIIGGRIWAESIRNSGSTFYVELPRYNSITSNNDANINMVMINKQREEAEKDIIDKAITKPINDNPEIILKQQSQTATEKLEVQQKPNNVPRGQALTPDQIAAYVARQRVLAQEQRIVETVKSTERAQSVSVPKRNIYY